MTASCPTGRQRLRDDGEHGCAPDESTDRAPGMHVVVDDERLRAGPPPPAAIPPTSGIWSASFSFARNGPSGT